MLHPRPSRPLVSSWPSPSSLIRFTHNSTRIMSATQKNAGQPGPHAKKEKNPPLTHFLCLPLVNSISLPQLESSLATFKSSIPSTQPDQNTRGQEPLPLIPNGAVRPVGTLHLTLGVMSLPTKERLEDAIRLLQSLDFVAMVREAEGIARIRAKGKMNHSSSVQESGDTSNESGRSEESEYTTTVSQPPKNFTVSLESLHPLPRARAATVLHAAPVDSTSRLYPFCEILRDKFLEAGFLQGEYKKAKQQGDQGQDNGLLEAAPSNQSEGSSKSVPVASKPKARPLLLHATVVNTIYAKGKRQGGKNRRGQLAFDARDILAHYKDYYLDGQRTTPRSFTIKTTTNTTLSGNSNEQVNKNQDVEDLPEKDHTHGHAKYGNPFVWAKDFPIDSVCISEMGAKRLDPEGDTDGMNARLGAKYIAVAERSLDFGSS